MKDAWTTLNRALRNTWDDLLTTAVCNLLWLVFSLLVITGPPATVALFYTGNRIARGEATDPQDFIRAVRRYFGLGWRWGLVNGAVVLVLVGDIVLTGRLSQSSAARFAQGFYLAALAVWLLLQLYTLSLLWEQETPSLRLALRNGVVMLGSNLVFSVVLGILLVMVLVSGTLLFLLSLAGGGVFVALAGNHAVLNRLRAYAAPANMQTRSQ